jgi:hypothetical protein
MNYIKQCSSDIKNRFFCSECNTFRHGFRICKIVRRKKNFLQLVNFHLDYNINTLEELIDFLETLNIEKLRIIAENYSLDTTNVVQRVLISNIANFMILKQSSQKIIIQLNVAVTPSAPPLECKTFPLKSTPLPSNILNTEECCICFEVKSKKEFIKTKCNHDFCRSCINQLKTTNNACACPLCRENI